MRAFWAFLPLAALAASSAAQDATDPHKIGDILKAHAETNLMVEIIPLGLSKQQYTDIAKALEEGRKQWDKDLAALEAKEAAALKKLESLVTETHKKALAGTAPTDEYFEKYNAVFKSAAADREALRRTAVKDLAAKIKAILTDDQYQKCIDSAKGAVKKASGGKEPDPKVYGDNSMYWYYVENVFMADLIPGLFKKLAE